MPQDLTLKTPHAVHDKMEKMNNLNNHRATLSANTLFHFTDHINKLEGILINEFYPRYSLENWSNIAGGDFEIGIPMVCFCDIPLSQISNHTNDYGSYAIGLTKEWGIENGICPVLYTFQAASTAGHIMDLFSHFQGSGMIRRADKVLDQTLVKLALFMKPYEGRLKKGHAQRERVRFYDEREWRYIPKIDEDKDKIRQYLGPDEFGDANFKEQETEKLKSKKVSFGPNDIKYIIVKSENEILDMYHKIQNIKGQKYDPNDVKKLQTRIISMEHISADF